MYIQLFDNSYIEEYCESRRKQCSNSDCKQCGRQNNDKVCDADIMLELYRRYLHDKQQPVTFEVKHTAEQYYYQCSGCHKIYLRNDKLAISIFKFCPHCGAKIKH